MPSEKIRVTARFKLKTILELDELSKTYREIVNSLLDYAFKNNITSFYRLKKETYKKLRKEYRDCKATISTPLARWQLQFTRVTGRERRKGRRKDNPFLRKKL